MLKALQRRMTKCGLTDQALADLAGLSQAAINAIRNGTRPNPTIDTYAAIVRALDKVERRQRAKEVA